MKAGRKVIFLASLFINTTTLTYAHPQSGPEPTQGEIDQFNAQIQSRFPIGSPGKDLVSALESEGYGPRDKRLPWRVDPPNAPQRHFELTKPSGRGYPGESFCEMPGEWIVDWTEDLKGKIIELNATHGPEFCI